MLNKENYYVILNGFEIKSISKADQLHFFRFYIDDPIFNEQTNQLLVKRLFNLVTNCRTLECGIFKNNTAYELTLKLLVFCNGDSLSTHFEYINAIGEKVIIDFKNTKELSALKQRNSSTMGHSKIKLLFF